jgi:hypothetical protein
MMTVQFFWLPKYQHQKDDRIDILTPPESSKGLTGTADTYVICDLGGENYKKIESGQSFRIVTENPQTHPLPDYNILDMQWHLQKLVSMSGAAGWCELDSSDSDSALYNGNDTIWNNDSILKWMSEVTSGSLICV